MFCFGVLIFCSYVCCCFGGVFVCFVFVVVVVVVWVFWLFFCGIINFCVCICFDFLFVLKRECDSY